jgi:3',5'-cyclic AMP phosphodiesterase CpdA
MEVISALAFPRDSHLIPSMTGAKEMTRRQALRHLSAGTLLALGLWPGSLSVKAKAGEPGAFKFIAVNDTHYMSVDCGQWLELVVAQMKTEGAEFCLLSGDLTEKGKREHLAAVRDIFRELGVPTYVQIGNHDWVSPTDRRAYERLFPRRLNYWFEHRGWQFVGLDSTQGQDYEKTNIQPATFEWIDANLRKLDPRKPTVIFTHFPLGEAVRYRPGNADELLERFNPFNLKGIFGGHYHAFTLRWQERVFALTNRCCALKRNNHDKSPGKGYLVCEARDSLITYRFVECHVPKELAAVAGESKKPK